MRYLALLACVGLAGCSVAYKDSAFSLLTIPPGDEVTSQQITDIGLNIEPVGAGGPAILIGYRRWQATRVPIHEQGAVVPDVKVTTKVDADTGAFINETLEVGQKE